MRHHVSGKKLGRNPAQRKSLYRGLIRSFFVRGRIRTTVAKAKAIKPQVEKLISLAKADNLITRRIIIPLLGRDPSAIRFCYEVGLFFKTRPGGYTRLARLGPRLGDGSEMAVLELTGKPDSAKEKSPLKKPPVKKINRPKKKVKVGDKKEDKDKK